MRRAPQCPHQTQAEMTRVGMRLDCRKISMFIQKFQGDSDGGMTEIRFVPDDASSLDSMFTAMSECQV